MPEETFEEMRTRLASQAATSPFPETISDRQFAQVLAMDALITQGEALAWVGQGTVPAPLMAAVQAIPDAGARFSALMLLTGATSFRRNHPLVSTLAVVFGKTEADLDDLWKRAAAL